MASFQGTLRLETAGNPSVPPRKGQVEGIPPGELQPPHPQHLQTLPVQTEGQRRHLEALRQGREEPARNPQIRVDLPFPLGVPL